MKLVVQEVEQNKKTWEENHHRIDQSVALDCTKFVEDAITEEMMLEAKVAQLGEIAEYLQKKVVELDVDEIVIDSNMDLQWPHRLSLIPPSPTCSALDPLHSGFLP